MGDNLKKLLEKELAAGESQSSLARKVGVAQSTIFNTLNNPNIRHDLRTFEKFSHHFGLTIDELRGEKAPAVPSGHQPGQAELRRIIDALVDIYEGANAENRKFIEKILLRFEKDKTSVGPRLNRYIGIQDEITYARRVSWAEKLRQEFPCFDETAENLFRIYRSRDVTKVRIMEELLRTMLQPQTRAAPEAPWSKGRKGKRKRVVGE
jgi:transcriptional regulator with XRE-family HTH domain